MSDMINEEEKIGKISIADGVVASIAGIAAIEVEGVSKLTGNISKELVAKLGKKNLANGVKVEIIDLKFYLALEKQFYGILLYYSLFSMMNCHLMIDLSLDYMLLMIKQARE